MILTRTFILFSLAIVGLFTVYDIAPIVRLPIDGTISAKEEKHLFSSYAGSIRSAIMRGGTSGLGICNILKGDYPFIPSTDTIWANHIRQILDASQLDSDPKYVFRDYTAQLLHMISPRLRRSVQTLPRDWSSVQHVIDVLEKRLRYLYADDEAKEEYPYPPKPLKILVIGGSVTSGKKCSLLSRHMGIKIPTWECTWTNRLESFFYKLTGKYGLVRVINASRGGSLTDFATKVFFKYGLLPKEIAHPDIVINAYATNDIVRLGYKKQELHAMIEESIRTVLNPQRTCSPPLLIHYDDFLGNRPTEILPIMESSQVFSLLSNYYGIGSISYPNMVRDIVYGDTDETWFSPDWGHDLGRGGEMLQQLHPNSAMYIVSSWVIVYYLLDAISNYCTLKQSWGSNNLLPKDELESYNASKMAEVIPWSGSSDKTVPGRPKAPPTKALPPVLNAELDIRNVTAIWRRADENGPNFCTEVSSEKSCPAAWVGLDGLNSASHKDLDVHFKQWGGWKFSVDHGKSGYSPSKIGDTAMMELHKKDKSQPIRRFLFLYMKSYGENWEGSKVAVDLEYKVNGGNTWSKVLDFEVEGWHNKQTSEAFIEDLELPDPIYPKDSVRITYKFIGTEGTTFKIMGIALCNVREL